MLSSEPLVSHNLFGTDRLAQCRVTTNLQFLKNAISVRHNKTNLSVLKYKWVNSCCLSSIGPLWSLRYLNWWSLYFNTHLGRKLAVKISEKKAIYVFSTHILLPHLHQRKWAKAVLPWAWRRTRMFIKCPDDYHWGITRMQQRFKRL